ncbi:MAG TPA: hypothetical protein VK687_01140 [Bryobacteraceae bacterium]|nr:hypothetical protein [Bryobacteraceae bacterium]
MPIQINIKVRPLNPPGRTGPDDPEDGTFEEPFPKVRVKHGKDVIWKKSGIVKAFKVTFHDSSPFETEDGDPVFEIADENPRTATVVGTHHYSVIATDGTRIWDISACPEIGVDL